MNVFVTGGAGYIGSVCAEQLLKAGHQVTVYDNLTEGHRSAVDERARFILGRPEEEQNILNALKEARPEAIVHFAANALVGESMTNPGKYFRNNVAAGINLLDAALESKVRKFVFSSTCATYGPDFVSFRYFNAAGASPNFGEHHRIETHLIPNVLKVPLGQAAQCEIFGADYPTPDGTCIRDYIHVIDLATAHILALAPGAHGCYNLGNGEGCSVREVITACEKIT